MLLQVLAFPNRHQIADMPGFSFAHFFSFIVSVRYSFVGTLGNRLFLAHFLGHILAGLPGFIPALLAGLVPALLHTIHIDTLLLGDSGALFLSHLGTLLLFLCVTLQLGSGALINNLGFSHRLLHSLANLLIPVEALFFMI